MSLLEVIILAVVQGITEFLPISSDGHLAVVGGIFEAISGRKLADPLEVVLILHLGTLASVLVFYRKQLLDLLTKDRRAILPLIVATIPAVIIGLGIEKGLPDDVSGPLLSSALYAGFGFLITAAFLWWGSKHQDGTLDYTELSVGKAATIGLMQAFAILPGVSRSGLTISTGLGVGLRRDAAATFSFLMAVPVIAGAGLLKIIDAIQEGGTGTPIPTLAVGFVVSMLVGLGALALLLRFLRGGQFHLFVYYLVPLAAIVIAWQLTRA